MEDTDTTTDEITDILGTGVALMVNGHSEDKSKTWKQRKAHASKELAGASRRMKMLVMADKVSNLRSMIADYRAIGDALWDRFNAPGEKYARYYSGIQGALWDMQNDPDTSPVYWEMVGLYKDHFVKFYKSFPIPGYYENYLLQVCADGSAFRVDKGNPEWKKCKNQQELIDSECSELPRKEAEAVEDDWASSCKVINGKDEYEYKVILDEREDTFPNYV